MTGQMKNPNVYPVVVTTPGGRVGGSNTSVTVNTNPTKYTGGFNKAACDVPTGKLKNK